MRMTFSASFLMLELTDGLEERLALDVADGAAHFDDRDLRVCSSGIAVEPALDLIGDMRDDLDGPSAEVAAALFLEYRPVDLAGGDVRVLGQALVDETLIVSEIQVCFRAVVCDEDFAVLDRVHGARDRC